MTELVWRHLTCYWNLLLFYHRSCRFQRKTGFSFSVGKFFINDLKSLHCKKENWIELYNLFCLIITMALRYQNSVKMALLSFRYFYFASNVFASLNLFLLSLKYFCFSSIFIQIFFPFLQIFSLSFKYFFLLSFKYCFALLQIVFSFPSNIFCFPSNIFLLSFKYFLQIILLLFKKFCFSSNVFASLQRFLYYFRFYCFALKLFSLLSFFKFYCFPLKLFFFAFLL